MRPVHLHTILLPPPGILVLPEGERKRERKGERERKGVLLGTKAENKNHNTKHIPSTSEAFKVGYYKSSRNSGL